MNSSSFGGRRNLLGFVMLSQAFALLVLLIYRNKLLLLRVSHLAASQEVMAAPTRSLLLSFMEGCSPAAVVGLVYMVCGTLVLMDTEPYDCIIEPLFCIRYIFSFLFSCEYFLLWIYSCDGTPEYLLLSLPVPSAVGHQPWLPSPRFSRGIPKGFGFKFLVKSFHLSSPFS